MIFITFAITSLIVLLIVLALVLAGIIHENDKFKKVIADKGNENINLKQRIHDLEALLRSFAKDLSEHL